MHLFAEVLSHFKRGGSIFLVSHSAYYDEADLFLESLRRGDAYFSVSCRYLLYYYGDERYASDVFFKAWAKAIECIPSEHTVFGVLPVFAA